MSEPIITESRRIFDELRAGHRDLVRTFGSAALIALVGFLIAFYFVEPPPPSELVIASGPADGNYFAATRQYAQLFEENGVKLTSRETKGSIENYELLLHDDSVRVAIVQGGTAPEATVSGRLESLAALYHEPLWVFCRRELSITDLSDLAGMRIAVGSGGSGTARLAGTLLEANGVQHGRDNTTFVFESGGAAVSLLRHADVDAGFFVLSAESPIVHDLLREDDIAILNFVRSLAYERRYPFLKQVTLAKGVIDLQNNLPPEDVQLIAPVANLVAVRELHDAFIPLLLEAATTVHEKGDLVTDPLELPSLKGVEFEPNAAARYYFKNGPSFLQKYFGFWLTSLFDRAKIMLVPLVILLIPLIKLVPPVYRWRIRSRIYRWYVLLRGIDQSLQNSDQDELRQFENKLIGVERELAEINVPLSYMEEFYHLRLHIDLLKRQIQERATADHASDS